jgi:hypoxanthine phosphoribosyltransferase
MSYQLGQQIFDSDFQPTFIVGVWRGGAPIGIAVQEYLRYKGITSDHIPIRTSSYTGIDQQAQVQVHGLKYLVKRANAGDRLLIIDDIFDTGRSVKAIIDQLSRKMRLNVPRDIRVATVLYKPAKSKVDIVPNYYIRTTDRWVVFPHELEGFANADEIVAAKGAEFAGLF